MNVTFLINRVFKDISKVRSCWIRVDLNSMTGVLARRGKFSCSDIDTQERKPCEDRSSSWSDAPVS